LGAKHTNLHQPHVTSSRLVRQFHNWAKARSEEELVAIEQDVCVSNRWFGSEICFL